MPRQQALLAKALSDEVRSSSVPPPQIRSVIDEATLRPQSIPPSLKSHARTTSDSQPAKDPTGTNPLDLMDLLQRSEPSVVKTRSGSVLSRGFILKTDHYPSGAHSFLVVNMVPDSRYRSCS